MCVVGLHILGVVLFKSGLDLGVSPSFEILSPSAKLIPIIMTRFFSSIAVLATPYISAAQLTHKEVSTKKVGMNSRIYSSQFYYAYLE